VDGKPPAHHRRSRHPGLRRTPPATEATTEESDKHKAMKERIARTAQEHGLTADLEARSDDGQIRRAG